MQNFPEGDFLFEEGDFCRSRELRQLQNTHHHALMANHQHCVIKSMSNKTSSSYMCASLCPPLSNGMKYSFIQAEHVNNLLAYSKH